MIEEGFACTAKKLLAKMMEEAALVVAKWLFRFCLLRGCGLLDLFAVADKEEWRGRNNVVQLHSYLQYTSACPSHCVVATMK